MKKIIFTVLFVIILAVAACQQQAAKQENQKLSGAQSSPAETTGDSTTDSFGSDMGSVNNDDKELSSSSLEGADSGFSDVDNI